MPVSRRHLLRTGLAFGLGAALPGASHAEAYDVEAELNIFISPCGQPFRGAKGAPYASALWFQQVDKNADGKIDLEEFKADAKAFFKVLDQNGDGLIESEDIANYELRICPEIRGFRYREGRRGPRMAPGEARVWRVQTGPAGGSPLGQIDPGGNHDPLPEKPLHELDETHLGASPFAFFDSPEPVAAADLDFNGRIRLNNFLRLADMRFNALDREQRGFLTLDHLPKTDAQVRLEKFRRKRKI